MNYSSDIFDFLGLTATWHEDATSPSLLSVPPPSYSFIELAGSPTKPFSSSHSSHGGSSLFYKSTFSAFNIHYPPYSSFEFLFSSFKSPSNFTFVTALIDRPPSSSFPLFLEEFSVLTETLYTHSSLFFILGDFDIPHYNRLSLYYLKQDIFLIFSISLNMLIFQHTLLGTLLLI